MKHALNTVIARLRAGEDAGNALVEFTVLGVLILVPLVYVLLMAFTLQSHAYAATGAAREAGRVFVTAPRSSQGYDDAQAAADLALRDQGVAPGEAVVDITCAADPCLSPGARVEIRVSTRVALPMVPAFVGRAVPAVVPVSAHYTAVVDALREARP